MRAVFPPMSSSSSSSSSGESRFTLSGLRQLHAELVANKAVTEENAGVVVEALRVIAEMVVYGDNKSELLFDFFCEKNMMALFLEIMWVEGGCPGRVHIQILQTLSILVNCVRNDTSLYYLLSNNYINEIIIYPHDFGADESLCDQYVSFMKSLSLRLDKQTIQFFFQEETGSFPLLNRAIDLLDFSEPMVRIAAQSTILNIYSVNEPRARQYALQDEVMHRLFVQIVKLLEAKHVALLSICREHAQAVRDAGLEDLAARSSLVDAARPSYGDDSAATASQRLVKRLEQQMQTHVTSTEDWLYYLQDIFGLRIMRLRRALVHHLMTEWVYPTLLAALLRKWSSSQLYGSRVAIAVKLRTMDKNQLQRLADDFHGSHDRDDEEEDDEEDEPGEEEEDMGEGKEGEGGEEEQNKKIKGVEVAGAEGGAVLNPAGVDAPPVIVALPMSPRRGTRKFRPTLSALEEKQRQEEAGEEEGDEDEDAMSLVASLLFLSQMLSTISDRMLHRAVVTALLHPLSRRGRKVALEAVWAGMAGQVQEDQSQSGEAEAVAGGNVVQRAERNPYREAVETLMRGGNHRLSLLTAGLLSAILQAQVDICTSDRDEQVQMTGGDAGLWLARCVGLWPLKLIATSEATVAAIEASTDAKAESEAGVEKAEAERVSAGEEDEAAEAASPPPAPATSSSTAATDPEEAKEMPAPPTALASRPRLRTESMERERARAKGLEDRHLKERDDLDDAVAESEAAFIIEPDIMSLHKLTRIAGLLAAPGRSVGGTASLSAPGGSPVRAKKLMEAGLASLAGLGSLVQTLLDALLHAPRHSLITVQVVAHALYSACLLAYYSHGSKAAANVALRADAESELRFVQQCLSQALQRASADLLARPNGTAPGAEPLFFVVQEELRRMQGRKWTASKAAILCNSLLYLPPSAEIVSALGIDYDVPICQVETVRREVQVVLLLKSLHERVGRLLGALSSGQGTALFSPRLDDLFAQSTGPDLAVFTDAGILENIKSRAVMAPGQTAAQFVQQGAAFEMKGKKFLDARLVAPEATAVVPPTSRSSFSKRRGSGNFASGAGAGAGDTSAAGAHSPPNNDAASPAAFSVTSYLFGYRRSSSASPASSPFSKVSSRLGPVFFIQHDFLLVLVGPQQGPLSPAISMALEDKFEASIVVPLVSTVSVLDLADKKRLRVVVRSWDPVVHMDQVGLEHAPTSWAAPAAGADDDSRASARAATHAHSFLHPRPQSALWQLQMVFDSEQACALAREHVEARALLLRSEMERRLTEVLRGMAERGV